MIPWGLEGERRFGKCCYPYPRVFLAKSAQAIEKNGDSGNCELRRVRKRLKTKERNCAAKGKRAGSMFGSTEVTGAGKVEVRRRRSRCGERDACCWGARRFAGGEVRGAWDMVTRLC